jgi:hypothetical protein
MTRKYFKLGAATVGDNGGKEGMDKYFYVKMRGGSRAVTHGGDAS